VSNINILVDKIGIQKTDAEWIIKNSKKHSVWIANEILKNNLNLNAELKEQIQKIIEWKKEDSFYNIKDLNFKEALVLAENFLESKKYKKFNITNFSLRNKKVVLDLSDYKWVTLKTKYDCLEEGNDMCHCVGNSDFFKAIRKGKKSVYSLRNINNRAKVTLEINSYGEIRNFFGRSNSVIQDSYIPYVAEFLTYQKKWQYFRPDYNVHTVNDTIAKIIMYSIHTENYELLNRIINGLRSSDRYDITWNLYYNLKSNLGEKRMDSKRMIEKFVYHYKEITENDFKLLSNSLERISNKPRPFIIKKQNIFISLFLSIKNTFKKWLKLLKK
jgi:hypothetical protein